MKKILLTRLLTALLIMLPAVLVSSCDDDYVWYPAGPPSGWSDPFYDSSLTGQWMLVSSNNVAVSPSAANYMTFYGNGRGLYTYWSNGTLVDERTAYWCEAPYGSYADYQINIQYEYSSPVTMSYWFSGRNTLYMEWLTGSGYVTYVYRRVNSIP